MKNPFRKPNLSFGPRGLRRQSRLWRQRNRTVYFTVSKQLARRRKIILFATGAAQALAIVITLATSLLPNIHNRAYAAGPYAGPHGSDVFVMLVKTDNTGTSGSSQFTIPTTGGGYNYSVDCNNDGSFDATGQIGGYTCSYGSAGTYSVVIDGTFPRIYFNNTGDRLKLLEVQQWGDNPWTSMQGAFSGAANFNITATDVPNLSNLTTLHSMFLGAAALNADLSNWDVSNVTSMISMFNSASSFNQPLGNWDVSNVTDMNNMLRNTPFNQDISDWDVGSVTNMYRMFQGASAFNQPIGDWDTSNVTTMQDMFQGATSFNQNINSWDVSNVTTMERMFGGATSFNQPLNNWDTSSLIVVQYVFQNASAFNQDISGWDVSGVTNMQGMFQNATSFNQDIGSWDVSNVTNMSAAFNGASAFNQPLNSWDVSNVTNMQSTFSFASAFNQNISGWDTSSLTNINSMFAGASIFNQPIGNWDVSNVTNMSGTFFRAYAFNQSLNDWDVSNVTTMYRMFYETPFNQDINDWDVGNVTDMGEMFFGASAFNQDIGGFDMSAVTNAASMFNGSGLSIETYDGILAGWSAQTLQNGVHLDAPGKAYCASATQRQHIIDTYSWTINDNGMGCIPEIATGGVVSLSHDEATVEINIIDDGGGAVHNAGIQYGEDTNYNQGHHSADDYGEGVQTVILNWLACDTTYHYRAFIITNAGTFYGNDATFTTEECPLPPVPSDLKLDITLSPPGLIQGQQAHYTFTVSNVAGGAYGEWGYTLYIVTPDGIELDAPFDEDMGAYTDGETYACYDYTALVAADVPALAYHLGTFYLCEVASEPLVNGESHSITWPFDVTGAVNAGTTMRAAVMASGEEADNEAMYGAQASTDDFFALNINNIAIYTGTEPGSTQDDDSNSGNNTNTATLANAGNGAAVALTTPDGTDITCANVLQEAAQTVQDGPYDYPLGLIEFCFDTESENNQVSLTFVTDLKPGQVKARKYNSNSKTYFDIEGATITQTIYQGKPALNLTYTITDNGQLDLDPTTGSIKDPVGLAVAPGALAETGTNILLLTFMALIGITGSIFYLRRHYM